MAARCRKPPEKPRAAYADERPAPSTPELADRLASLYSMVRAIGSERDLERVLDISKRELTVAMGVQGLSVKLLDERGQRLTYAAVHGLPADFAAPREVSVAKSAVNRRVLEGESFVTGDVSEQEMFQFGENLAAAGIRSVLFVPLQQVAVTLHNIHYVHER